MVVAVDYQRVRIDCVRLVMKGANESSTESCVDFFQDCSVLKMEGNSRTCQNSEICNHARVSRSRSGSTDRERWNIHMQISKRLYIELEADLYQSFSGITGFAHLNQKLTLTQTCATSMNARLRTAEPTRNTRSRRSSSVRQLKRPEITSHARRRNGSI
jgi:hypothetical protein